MTDETTQPDLAEQLAAAKIITDHQFKRMAELEERNASLEELLRKGFAPSEDLKDLRLQAQDRLLNKYQPIIEILAKDYQWDSGTGPSLHYIRNMARAAQGVKLLTPADYKKPEATPTKAKRSAPIAPLADHKANSNVVNQPPRKRSPRKARIKRGG